MINIDFLTLRAFFIENSEFIINSRVQKIQQPTRRDFILFLRNNGVSKKLYINIFPQIYHIAFMSEENEKKRNITIPKKPPMFCMLLRKYIDGAKITNAKIIQNERILELYFTVYDELSQKRLLCLTIELMGKHSNIILYDKETDIIIGCAHNVGAEKSQYRELQGGLKYIYPPIANICLSNELKEQFRNLNSKQIEEYLYKTNFSPALKGDKYTLFSELLENSTPLYSVNEMLDNYYSRFQEAQIFNSEKNKILEIINNKIKKNNNTISKISNLLSKRNNEDKYKLYGDLLTANLFKKSDFKKSIEVFDYINSRNILIELDETKTLSENAQRYYKLYTKSKITKEKSNEMLKQLNIEHEYLANIAYSINTAQNITELDDIKLELGYTVENKEKTNKTNITKIDIDGYTVYVGKNNKQNDYIVSKLAKDDDYWFHIKQYAGSHVLLKVNGIEPNDNTIYECCKLAKEYSSSNQPSKVGILYTKAKNLRKPPAAPLGYVTYKNEKEILI